MTTAHIPAPSRILIVEDEGVIAHAIEARLQAMGYEVCGIMASGEQALDGAKELRPDLILMDIMLKDSLDGIETAERLRETMAVPIVFMTAYSDDEILDRAKRVQPYGYVLKPFQPRELRVSLDIALHMAEIDARRRRAETALRESEAKYRSVVENANNAVAVLSHGEVVFSNTRFNEFGGNGLLPILLPMDEELAGGGRPITRRERAPGNGGAWLEIMGRRIQWNQNPASIFSVSDVTDTFRIEDELRRSKHDLERRVKERTADLIEAYQKLKDQIVERTRVEETLALAQKIAHIGTWGWDPSRRKLFFSNEGYRILGLEPEETDARPIDFMRYLHPRDRKLRKRAMRQLLDGTGEFDIEVRVIRPDGRNRIFHEQAVALRYEDGVPFQLVGTVQDITERKQAETELLRREEEFRSQAKRLEEANIGLKVLIQHREEEKQVMREDVINTIKKLIDPFVQRLKKSSLSAQQEAWLSIIETNLAEIGAPTTARLSSNILGLTPTELEVANLVKAGRTIDEIAELLHVSDNAIRFHRKNIRAKLGLKHRKVNLRTYLQQMG